MTQLAGFSRAAAVDFGDQLTNMARDGVSPPLALKFGHSGVPIPVDLPEGETKIARQFTAGNELELIESRRDG
jgi:hypothetical protein